MEMTAVGGREGGASSGERLGGMRWTVCAMLFAATSINYIGRPSDRDPEAYT